MTQPDFERARQAFAARFTPDGDGFVYRRGSGSAWRVTAVEREAFVAAYRRDLLVLMVGLVAALTVVPGGAIWLWETLDPGNPHLPWVLWAVLAIAIPTTFVLIQRIETAPDRALKDRPPL